MDKRTYHLLFLIFSILYIFPVWLVEFLPFVDLPQHLNFAFILKNYNNPALNYNKIYSLRLFPMHNTFHLFFNYLLSFILALEISNKIYITISLLLFPLALWFLIKTLGGNEYFSLLGFLISYNYNLFWGFMGINIGIPFILLLISYEIKYLRGEGRNNHLIIIGILFLLLFLCHSLVYIFSFFTYLLILAFNIRGRFLRRGLPLTLPLLLTFIITFLPWQIGQFGGEGSEIQQQFRQYLTPLALYNNLWDFLRRVGIKTDETYIFILKLILLTSLFTTFYLIRRRGIGFLFRDNYRHLSFFFLSAFLFYSFFPGMYTEAVFLNERFAPLLFLLLITLLAMNLSDFRHRLIKYLLIIPLFTFWLSLQVRFLLYDREVKPVKEMLLKLPEGKRIVGLFYQKRPKADFFGYDTFIHLPCYYSIYKKGLCGFTFAYIRYSPIIYNEPYPLPRIDEWETWYSIFPEGWEEYDYFLIAGEERLSDKPLIEKFRLIEKRGIWTLYEAPAEIKPKRETSEEQLSG